MLSSPADIASDLLTQTLWEQYEQDRKVFLAELYAPRDSLGRRTHAKSAMHGTRARYDSQKCRCDLCKAAYLEYYEQYRRRQGKKKKRTLTHGTRTMYQAHGCRCIVCVKVMRTITEKARRAKGMTPRHTKSNRRHYYEEECRCKLCLAWHEELLAKKREARRKSSTAKSSTAKAVRQKQ